MDGLAIGDPRGAAAQRNAKVGKDAAGLAGRYTSSSRQQEASRRNHKSAVVLHTGGRCVLPSSGTSVLHAASEGRKQARPARRMQVRSGHVRPGILGNSNWQQPGLLSVLSLSLSPLSVLCACLVRVHLSGSPASAFLLRHRASRLFMESPDP